MTNCILAGNGIGLEAVGFGSVDSVNSTFASRERALKATMESSLNVTNCILSDNSVAAIELDETSAATVSYSCVDVEDVWTGEGNINADPLFVLEGFRDDGGKWVDGDYRLQSTSPCLDAGTTAGAPSADI